MSQFISLVAIKQFMGLRLGLWLSSIKCYNKITTLKCNAYKVESAHSVPWVSKVSSNNVLRQFWLFFYLLYNKLSFSLSTLTLNYNWFHEIYDKSLVVHLAALIKHRKPCQLQDVSLYVDCCWVYLDVYIRWHGERKEQRKGITVIDSLVCGNTSIFIEA